MAHKNLLFKFFKNPKIPNGMHLTHAFNLYLHCIQLYVCMMICCCEPASGENNVVRWRGQRGVNCGAKRRFTILSLL